MSKPARLGTPIKIAINAQRTSNSGSGGIESVLIGLISSLGKLEDGLEEYTIIGPWEDPDWLKPYIGNNQTIVRGPKPQEERPWANVPNWLQPTTRGIHKNINRFINPSIERNPVQLSDGFFERLGCDLIHFPYQIFTLCALPSIYNPHDLQHLHFPQFFTPGMIRWRENMYAAGCQYAQVVVTGSQWVKDDVIKNYHVNPEKIQVIPWAPPTQSIVTPAEYFIETVRKKYDLPEIFAFYPSMMWEHKNHLRLLDSLALLRDQKKIKINLVCTGNFTDKFWPRIADHIKTLRIEDQVKFLGVVPFVELRALYRLSQFVVVPTLFEAASGPVFEAWQEETPVACSSVTSLPEQTGDAALLFDPYSVEAIADAIFRISTDEQLRKKLAKNGMRRLADFSWERTAKAYRAVYRKVAHRTLTEEDYSILNWDWMRNPKNNLPEKS